MWHISDGTHMYFQGSEVIGTLEHVGEPCEHIS